MWMRMSSSISTNSWAHPFVLPSSCLPPSLYEFPLLSCLMSSILWYLRLRMFFFAFMLSFFPGGMKFLAYFSSAVLTQHRALQRHKHCYMQCARDGILLASDFLYCFCFVKNYSILLSPSNSAYHLHLRIHSIFSHILTQTHDVLTTHTFPLEKRFFAWNVTELCVCILHCQRRAWGYDFDHETWKCSDKHKQPTAHDFSTHGWIESRRNQ